MKPSGINGSLVVAVPVSPLLSRAPRARQVQRRAVDVSALSLLPHLLFSKQLVRMNIKQISQWVPAPSTTRGSSTKLGSSPGDLCSYPSSPPSLNQPRARWQLNLVRRWAVGHHQVFGPRASYHVRARGGSSSSIALGGEEELIPLCRR